MTTPFRCPECDSVLDLDDRSETESTVWRPTPGRMPVLVVVRRPAIVAFCSGCDFAIEVRP